MNRNLSFFQVVLAVICVLAILAIVLPVTTVGHVPAYRTTCLSNIKQATLAQVMYAGDENDHFPDAAVWVDLTEPYTKSLSVFQCSEVPSGQFGFAMNDAMSKAKAPPEAVAAKTLLLFESTDTSKNAHGGLSIYTSPGRHKGTSMVSYADGHAKAIPPGKRP